jgi:ATP-dependent helicase/nuclease subunit A
MIAMKLTDEQILTQTIDRNISVTANAGTGKTFVLVRRYINILSKLYEDLLQDTESTIFEDYSSKSVLAITFTKKAASEMKIKVMSKIDDKLQELQKQDLKKNKNLSEEILRYKIIRKALSNARISTIHSFCSSVIRDFSIEAGVLPNFYEMSASEKSRIENDSILSVTESWLESSDTEKANYATAILRIMNKDDFVSMIKSIMDKRNIFERLDNLYSMTVDDFIKYRNKHIHNFIKSYISRFQKLKDFSEFYIYKDNLTKNTLQKVSDGEKNLKDLLENFSTLSVGPCINDLKKILELCLTTMGCFLTKEGVVNSNIYKKSETERADEINDVFDKLPKFVQAMKDVLEYDELDSEMFNLSKHVFKLTKEILEEIERTKQELNGLDFEDLLIKTRDLLKIEKVQKKVVSQLAYLMVDEFQDTNDIQYEIIKSLIPELGGNEQKTSGINLFIVGDGKQSIYGFRNADIRVFMQARRDIQKYNKILIDDGKLSKDFFVEGKTIKTSYDDQSQGKLDLRVTFRLNPVPASFVNIVCSGIMDPQLSEFEVEYSEFVCAKGAEKVVKKSNENIGKVSFLISEDDAALEMDLIAKYISKIMSDPDYRIVDSDNIERRPVYSDIGILARKKRSFPMLGEALSKYNIPYTIHSGFGFFKSQEVLDIISFLKFLHNTNDDAAFAAILRSPFFDIYDDKILQISVEKAGSLWEKYCSWIEKNYDVNSEEEDSTIIEAPLRAYKISHLLLSLAPRLTLSQLVIKILDECSWFATARVSSNFKQKEANMEKFIQFSRDFEERGFRNLYDFVDELDYVVEQDLKEAEATLITGDDSLVIMTIHSAKGLEFPIVILCDTNTSTGVNQPFCINDFMGITYGMKHDLEDRNTINVDSISHYLSENWTSLAEDAEEKRLLYVAMTRAISHLVISANIKRTPKGGIRKLTGMISLILDGLSLSIEGLVDKDNFEKKDKVKLLYENNIVEGKIDYNIEIIKKVEDSQAQSPLSQHEIYDELNLIEGIPPEPSDSIFSATKLTLFKEDRDSFIDRYILGLPQDLNNDKFAHFKNSEDNDEANSGAEVGSMIHKTLEKIKDWIMPDGKVDTKILNDTIDNVLTENSRSISDELRLRIVQECTFISSTNLLMKYSPYLPAARTEYYLQIPVNNNILVGAIDMLIQNDKREWEIWDWKSNNVSGKKQMKELALHYEMQMKVYAGLFSLIEPDQTSFTCRLLFTRRAKNNAKDTDWTYTFEWDRSQTKNFLTEMERSISEINEY